MPRSAPRPCGHRGCSDVVRGFRRFCNAHADEELDRARLADARRGTAAARGYGHAWRKYRETFILDHPTCCDPDQAHPDEVRPTEVVDHVVPHRGDESLFWDPDNHQPLCRECHNRKTGRGE